MTSIRAIRGPCWRTCRGVRCGSMAQRKGLSTLLSLKKARLDLWNATLTYPSPATCRLCRTATKERVNCYFLSVALLAYGLGPNYGYFLIPLSGVKYSMLNGQFGTNAKTCSLISSKNCMLIGTRLTPTTKRG